MKKIVNLLLMILLVACSGEIVDPGDANIESAPVVDTTDVVEEAAAEVVVEEIQAEEPVVVESGAVATEFDGQSVITDSGLQYIEIEEGTGAAPEVGSVVAVHYTGTLVDGTVFDSSVDRGQPIEFPLGTGRVIPGWDEGIGMMKEGGKAILVIPSELGYGAGGSGSIPPDSTLIFEVELVSVGAAAAGAIPQPAPAADLPLTAEEYDGQGIVTDSGLQYVEVEEGSGAQAEADRIVMVHYTGKLTDGTVFDSSEGREPFSFALGRGAVIPGWDEGVALMKEGGKAVLVIPAAIAYGDRGAGGIIPPGATLVFDVELVEVGEEVASSPESFEAIADADYTTTDSGLQYFDIEVGQDGTPEIGVPISMHFTIWFESGEKIDSSIDAGQPIPAVLGQGQLFPGWEEGVATMQYGGVRQLRVPSDLAFGEEGIEGFIPPNSILVMQVELLQP